MAVSSGRAVMTKHQPLVGWLSFLHGNVFRIFIYCSRPFHTFGAGVQIPQTIREGAKLKKPKYIQGLFLTIVHPRRETRVKRAGIEPRLYPLEHAFTKVKKTHIGSLYHQSAWDRERVCYFVSVWEGDLMFQSIWVCVLAGVCMTARDWGKGGGKNLREW